MTRVLIVDDNENMCRELRKLIAEVASEDVEVEVRNSGSSTLIDMEVGVLCPDIVFVDIELGRQNGIDVAEEMLKLMPGLQVIFISGHDDYYIDVYKVEHEYFIRKPFDKDVLRRAWQTVMQRHEKDSDSVFTFKTGSQYKKFRYRDIMCFEMERRKVWIYTSEGEFSFYGTMQDVLDSVGDGFMQCHKSYVINLRSIKEYHTDHVFLADGRQIPISRTFRKDVRERFMEQLMQE